MTVEFLERHLDRMISFVRYAETKNATLLAGATALLIGVFPSLSQESASTLQISISVIAFFSLLFVLVDVSASFLPAGRAKLSALQMSDDDLRELSFLYFGDISRLDVASYIRKLELSDIDMPMDSVFKKDLVEQILQNARICKRKMSHFDRAMRFLIVATIMLAVAALGNSI